MDIAFSTRRASGVEERGGEGGSDVGVGCKFMDIGRKCEWRRALRKGLWRSISGKMNRIFFMTKSNWADLN